MTIYMSILGISLLIIFRKKIDSTVYWGVKTPVLLKQILLWVNPSRQLHTTLPLAHRPQCDGEENQKGKNEKTCGLR